MTTESAAQPQIPDAPGTFLRFAVRLDVPRLAALETQFAHVASRAPELRHRQAGIACRTAEEVTRRPAAFHEAPDLSSPALVVHCAVGPTAAIGAPPRSVRCSAILEGRSARCHVAQTWWTVMQSERSSPFSSSLRADRKNSGVLTFVCGVCNVFQSSHLFANFVETTGSLACTSK